MRASASVFALLAFAASTLASSEFNLGSLEPISKSEVTSDCYAAYTTPLAGCTSSTSTTCSAECISSISSASTLIQEDCADAFVGVDSLLRRTVDGGLLSILCPSAVVQVIDSTMVAPSVLSTTIYAAASMATAGVDSAIETDSASAAKTSGTPLAVDTAPTPTAGMSGTSLQPLFASATASASGSAAGASGVYANAAAGSARVKRWAVAAVLGAVVMTA